MSTTLSLARMGCWTVAAVLALSTPAQAQNEGAEVEDPKIVEARAAFMEGNALAKNARWGDALARFEASAKLRPHPGTTYNIGVCQRALG